MIDREKVLTVLRRRFPGATSDEIAAAANAIVGLKEEWQELKGHEAEVSAHFAARCGHRCELADQIHQGAEFRVFRRVGI